MCPKVKRGKLHIYFHQTIDLSCKGKLRPICFQVFVQILQFYAQFLDLSKLKFENVFVSPVPRPVLILAAPFIPLSSPSPFFLVLCFVHFE